MTYDITPRFGNREEEEVYRQQQAIPTHAAPPRIAAPAYGWTNGVANRYLSGNGGSISSGSHLDRLYGQALYGPEAVDQARTTGHPADAVGDVGKFVISAVPERAYAPFDPTKDPPPRQIGDFEGIFGGLTRLATGFLPKDVQDTLAKLPEALGTLIDAPFGLARHDLPGFGVAESFERMASTPEKEALREKIAGASPTWAHWYMTEYINTHMGDFSDAHGIPHAMGMLMAPGQTPIGRLFGAMNVPYEAATRTIAGGALDWLPGVEMDRATELLNTPDEELHPLLLDLKKQYMRGDFDEDGLLDRLTSQGFGLTNDHFHGMLLSFITDPLILASFGTGTFARMTSVGGMAQRAMRLSSKVFALDESHPMRQLLLQSRVEAATRRTSFGRYANRDLSFRAVEHFIEQRAHNPEVERIVREVEDSLPVHQRLQVRIERIAKPANVISEMLNSPFGIFGENGAGRAVFRKWTADTSQGFWRGHEMSTAVNMLDGISNPDGAAEAAGYTLANRQMGLVLESLHKQLRVEGKGENPFNLPDSVNMQELVKAAQMMENPLSAREMESFTRATRRIYVPEPDPNRTPEQHAEYMRTWTSGMNETAAQKFAYAVQVSIEEARQRVGHGGDDVWSLVDDLHWGRLLKDFGSARALDVEEAGHRMDALSQGSAARIVEEGNTSRTARATLIGPRELSDQRAASVLVLVKKALSTNAPDDIAAALSALSRYDQLRNNFFSQTKNADDNQMLRWMERYIEQGLKEETFVKTIADRAQLDAPQMWRLLDETNARMGVNQGVDEAYELGIGPTPDKAISHVLDDEGNLIGYRAWVDAVPPTPSGVRMPTTMANLRFRLLTPIRSEHILQENRRRFIVLGADKFGLREADSVALWSALRKAGLRGNRTLRSFRNEDLENVVAEAAISDQLKKDLGGHGLQRLTALAMEGDIRMSGVIPKLTGKLKTTTAGQANNAIGHTSEYIYPYLRFNISPFFLLQEYVEPFFWNVLRGVKVGFKEAPEDSAFRSMVFSIGGDELMAHDAMAREVRTIGVYASRASANPSTQIGKEVAGRLGRIGARLGVAGVASTKWINHTNLTLERWGVAGRKMINDMELHARGMGNHEFDGAWDKIASDMQRLVDEGKIRYRDPKTGQMVTMKQRQLTDGEVVRLFVEQNGISQTSRTWQTQLWDGQNPSSLGRVSGIRSSNLAGIFHRDSGATLRADIANRTISQWEFRGTLSRLGFDSDYVRRAWDMMRGPDVETFLDSVERVHRQAGRAPSDALLAKELMRAHLETYAVVRGISPEEAVARKYARTAQYLNVNQSLPSNAYPQSVARNISDHGYEIVDDAATDEVLRLSSGRAQQGVVLTGERARIMDELDSREADRADFRQNEPDAYRQAFGAEPPSGPMANIEDIDNRIEALERADAGSVGAEFGARQGDRAERIARLRAEREILMDEAGYPSLALPGGQRGAGEVIEGTAVRVEEEPLVLSSEGPFAGADLVPPENAPRWSDWEAHAEYMEARGGRDEVVHTPTTDFDGRERHVFTKFDENGKVVAVFAGTAKTPGSKVLGQTTTVTKESERRKGHATSLHDEAEAGGFTFPDMGKVVTAEGEAFVQGRAAKKAAQVGEVITGAEAQTPAAWRVQVLDDLDEQTITAVMDFDRDLARLVRSVTSDPDEAAQLHSIMRSDPEMGMSLVSHLVTAGGDLQAMLARFTPSPPPAHYQAIADDMNRGVGFMGKTDWTAYDVANVERVRARRVVEQQPRRVNVTPEDILEPDEYIPGLDANGNPIPYDEYVRRVQAFEDTQEGARTETFLAEQAAGDPRAELLPLERRLLDVEGMFDDGLDTEGISEHGRLVSEFGQEAVDEAQRGLEAWQVDNPGITARTGYGDDFDDTLDFADGVSIEAQLPLHTMPEDVAQAISAEVAPLVAEAVGRRTGARIVGIEDSMEGPMDAGALVTRGTRFVVESDSPGAIRDAADELAVLTGRETYVIDAGGGKTVIGFDPSYGDGVTYMSRQLDELDEGLVRELDDILLTADEALQDIDEEAWAANRGRYEHSAKFEPDTYRYQRGRGGRGWRGATAFDRRHRAQLYINDNADLTTIVHETFHSWARDLDRSGKKVLVDAYKSSRAYTQTAVARRPTGAKLNRKAEEWAAEQFEAYVGSGLAPDPTLRLHPIYNAYAQWGRRSGVIGPARVSGIHPKLHGLFEKITPEVHGKNVAVFDTTQFRIMEAFRIALLRAEDESHTVHYFRRGKTLLERSINHPFFGLYPVSYMYGKVLPELARFMFTKPFGVKAPLAGAAMWNHVYDAMMLEMSGNSDFAQVLNDNPEAVRFLSLVIPGLPNDMSVNMSAWMRRVMQASLTGTPIDFGKTFTDYLGYAMSDRASPETVMDGFADSWKLGQDALSVFGGQQYQSETELKEEASLAGAYEDMYGQGVATEPYSEAIQ